MPTYPSLTPSIMFLLWFVTILMYVWLCVCVESIGVCVYVLDPQRSSTRWNITCNTNDPLMACLSFRPTTTDDDVLGWPISVCLFYPWPRYLTLS